MSTVILTHNSNFMAIGRGSANLQIQVTLEVTSSYTIKFTYRPIGGRPYDASQEKYIRDIPYIPNAILEAIKLMHLTDDDVCGGGDGRIFQGLTQILLEQDFKKEMITNLFQVVQSQEIAKIKKEHEIHIGKIKKEHKIIATRLQDDLTNVQSQLSHSEDKITRLQTRQHEFDKLQCDKIELQKLLENKLQEINRLTEIQTKMKKYETTNTELSDEKTKLCEKNKRFLEMINNEKLKNSLLTDKLNDITELYESLLHTTY
jgi:hypothetical protein